MLKRMNKISLIQIVKRRQILPPQRRKQQQIISGCSVSIDSDSTRQLEYDVIMVMTNEYSYVNHTQNSCVNKDHIRVFHHIDVNNKVFVADIFLRHCGINLSTSLARLIILIEDECGATGFKLLAEVTPAEDFLYPIPEIFQGGAKQYRGKNRRQISPKMEMFSLWTILIFLLQICSKGFSWQKIPLAKRTSLNLRTVNEKFQKARNLTYPVSWSHLDQALLYQR